MAWGAYRAKAESEAGQHYFATWSVRKKLLVGLIPSILLILVVAGYVTNWFSARYLNQALQRTAQVQNLAQAREVEQLLEYFRQGALNLARQQPNRSQLNAALAEWAVHHPGAVKELSFVTTSPAETVFLVPNSQGVVEIRSEQYHFIKGSPVAHALKVRGLKPGHVLLSELTEVVYPPSAFAQNGAGQLPDALQMGPQTVVVYRLITTVRDDKGAVQGYLVIGLDAYMIRNILSLYNSPKSPLYAFARTSETRFSYFFDDQGWILFQSENYEEPERELSAETARMGMTGDYGMPDYDKAFRPQPKHEAFWRMVVDIQAGRGGVDDVDLPSETGGWLSSNHYIAYAPVRFRSNPETGPEVIGGVAYVDRSRLSDAAEFRHLDAMIVISLSGMGLVTLVIFFISRIITKPLHQLAEDIGDMFEQRILRPIKVDSRDLESGLLTRALNQMIQSIQEKQEQIRRRDEQIHKVQQREKVSFDNEIPATLGWRLVGEIPDLIGQSQMMANLQSMIRKAASTEADVLVVGETGTGKELTAEGIHKFSSRADKAFISINCGGLDENLLMDTLFGHVKGAFTEARHDRKGAFLASDGGTLFLDEIGTATDKVQKALLRALSVRRIRPLGSDQEIEFNVRVIAATNVDLMELVQRGEFRDDLYYRLKVISIQTPALRQRREDIPVLAKHFLKDTAAATGRGEVGLSRGALDKLMNHAWPGNVRELKNCITRAMAFSEGDVLYAEDLVFDDASVSPEHDSSLRPPVGEPLTLERLAVERPMPSSGPRPESSPASQPPAKRSSDPPQGEERLRRKETTEEPSGNQRAQVALRLAQEKGAFSRLDYQKAVGADISQRTAQYDLQSLVKRGALRKTGKGPATLYLLS